jgi:drug/metabolite transporter (DMT)-like permease
LHEEEVRTNIDFGEVKTSPDTFFVYVSFGVHSDSLLGRILGDKLMQLSPDLILGSTIGLIGAALYGLSVVVYRSQADGISPVATSAMKMWIALPFMATMTILLPGLGAAFLPLTAILLLSISVLFGAVVGDTIYLWSQERIGVSYAFPIAMSFPIITFFLTVGFLGEELILSRLLGAGLAVIGISLISIEQNRYQEPGEVPKKLDVLGILGAIVTALLYATGTTVLQVGIEGVDPIAGNLVRMTVGSIAFVPMVAVASFRGMKVPTRAATIRVVIAGFFGMAVGSLFYVTAVSMVGAAIMSVLASTAPLFAVPVSVFYLKEKLSALAVVGIAFTLSGVFMVILGDAMFQWLLPILGQL